MEEITKIISENIDKIVSYIFGLVGLISALWTYRSFQDGRKKDKRYEYLLEIADKNIEKDINDKDLKEAKEQLFSLRRDIRDSIPIEAERAVLVKKLESQVEQLKEQYEDICETKRKLLKYPTNNTYSNEVEQIIQSEIIPQYDIKWRVKKAKDNIVVFSLGFLIAIQILPYPLSSIVSIIAILMLAEQFRILMSGQKPERNSMIFVFAQKSLLLFSFAINILFVFYIFSLINVNSGRIQIYGMEFDRGLGIVIYSLFPYICLVLIEISYISLDKRIRKVLIVLSFIISKTYIIIFFLYMMHGVNMYVFGEKTTINDLIFLYFILTLGIQLFILYKFIKTKNRKKISEKVDDFTGVQKPNNL